jgi:hypothetical protein
MRRTAIKLMLATALSVAAAPIAFAENMDVGLPSSLPQASNTYHGGLMSLGKIVGSGNQGVTQVWIGDSNNVARVATYCSDLLEHSVSPPNLYSVDELSTAPRGTENPSMGIAKADAVAKLWNAYVKPASSTPSNETLRAAQLAIWEIAYEPILDFDLSGGRFQGTGNPNAATAQAMLTDIKDHPNYAMADLMAFTTPSRSFGPGNAQNLVSEVPEAANVISLAAIALAASIFNLKRLRRRTPAAA